MTRGSIGEYTEAVRERYFRALKKEKGRILDEFESVMAYHRKAVIRLLHRGNLPRTGNTRGRPREYGAAVLDAIKVVWQVTDRLCFKRYTHLFREARQLAPDSLLRKAIPIRTVTQMARGLSLLNGS